MDIARETGCDPSTISHWASGDYLPGEDLLHKLEEVVNRVISRMFEMVMSSNPSIAILGFNLTSGQSPCKEGLQSANDELRAHFVRQFLGVSDEDTPAHLPAGARGAIARVGGGVYLIYVSPNAAGEAGAIFDHEVSELRNHIICDKPLPSFNIETDYWSTS
ncbi:MAG: helix-turn-helix transcriptional regulator [Phycisphaerales bacterium]|nr:helix-turn-helix transcriptional regulator [Phycisphaerales bacterium]